MPSIRVNFLFLNTHNHKITPAAIATKQSIKKLETKFTGVIKADVPTTNKMLKILLPTIFPIAMSAFPFFAAMTEVNNSGKDVPRATIVSPIKRSLIPNILARLVAASTVTSLPHTTNTKPIPAFSKSFQTEPETSISSACISPLLHIKNIYPR